MIFPSTILDHGFLSGLIAEWVWVQLGMSASTEWPAIIAIARYRGPMDENRFQDDFSRGVYSFIKRVLVVCPACSNAATLSQTERRLTCGRCGLVRNDIAWSTAGSKCNSASLSRFLRAPTCGEELWAFNCEHLAYLRDYVAAKHRTRERDAYGWSNRSLASRLPKWIASAKNRDDVLRAIERLEKRLCALDVPGQ